MSETGIHTWSCPACGRRVPLRAPSCHCGMTRERAAALSAGGSRPVGPRTGRVLRRQALALWRSFPRDVKALVLAGAFVLAFGLGWLAFAPAAHESLPAILGHVDASPPPPPAKHPPKPPFKLPWWK